MKTIAIKCPNCGADVQLTGEPDITTGQINGFCSHCGTPIVATDEIDRHLNINYDKNKEQELILKQKRYDNIVNELAIKRKRALIILLGCLSFMIITGVVRRIIPNIDKLLIGEIFSDLVLVALLVMIVEGVRLIGFHEKRDKLDESK